MGVCTGSYVVLALDNKTQIDAILDFAKDFASRARSTGGVFTDRLRKSIQYNFSTI